MAALRRKWRVEPDQGWQAYSFPSEPKAYEYVQKICKDPGGTERIKVWIDERAGRGWELFEVQTKGEDF